MKKVLYVCPTSGVGSPETFIKQTAAQTDSSKFENHYLLFESGPLFHELNRLGAMVHLLNEKPRLAWIQDRNAVHKQLKDLINENNIDLVHSTTATGAIYSAWTCRTMKTPHVWFQHFPARGWRDRLAAVLPHQGLIVNSHYTGRCQRKIENALRFLIPRTHPIEKILSGTTVVEMTDDKRAQLKRALITKLQLNDDTFVAAMLGRIKERKGQHLFLKALVSLKQSGRLKNFHGVIWGDPDDDSQPYWVQLQKTVEQHDLPVSFVGRSANPTESLAACDVLVNASISPEPFGASIIEGMMVGTVPIVPNEGGPTEIVKHGSDGLQFKARKAGSLAEQLQKLLDDKNLTAKLASEAQESARQKYNSERVIRHLEDFYSRILKID